MRTIQINQIYIVSNNKIKWLCTDCEFSCFYTYTVGHLVSNELIRPSVSSVGGMCCIRYSRFVLLPFSHLKGTWRVLVIVWGGLAALDAYCAFSMFLPRLRRGSVNPEIERAMSWDPASVSRNDLANVAWWDCSLFIGKMLNSWKASACLPSQSQLERVVSCVSLTCLLSLLHLPCFF